MWFSKLICSDRFHCIYICILAIALSFPVSVYQKYISIGGFVDRPEVNQKMKLETSFDLPYRILSGIPPK
jgi:hypothetical protein